MCTQYYSTQYYIIVCVCSIHRLNYSQNKPDAVSVSENSSCFLFLVSATVPNVLPSLTRTAWSYNHASVNCQWHVNHHNCEWLGVLTYFFLSESLLNESWSLIEDREMPCASTCDWKKLQLKLFSCPSVFNSDFLKTMLYTMLIYGRTKYTHKTQIKLLNRSKY